ncbi:MAG TPA: FHA domain-containing protein [Xanthomonadaceae bacterium]|nr:FHA domain-containing protein [Xanthomonadaceae bacterium]
MKLLFPNGEHAQHSLREGVSRIGSAEGCEIRLDRDGVAPEHCRIELSGVHGRVFDIAPGARVLLNGKAITAETQIRPGDLLAIGGVQSRVVAFERAAPTSSAPTPAPPSAPVDEVGRTKVRMAVPRHILRGVSGSTFGKNFPVFGTMTIGRMSECEISIPSEEISRHHVRVQTLPEGLMVEDLGSSNGTFINDERVHKGVLKPGDELRLDTLRFLLVTPGMDSSVGAQKRAPAPTSQPAAAGSQMWIWIVVGVVVLGAVAAGLKFAGVF